MIARIIEVRDGGAGEDRCGQVERCTNKPTGFSPSRAGAVLSPNRLFITSVDDDTSIARLPDLPSQAPPLAVGQYVVVRK